MVSCWTSSVCPSIGTSIYCFRLITCNINEFSPNLVCDLILWRCSLGLLMGKFYQFLTELSARHTIVMPHYCFMFLFPDPPLFLSFLSSTVNVLKFRTPKCLTKWHMQTV